MYNVLLEGSGGIAEYAGDNFGQGLDFLALDNISRGALIFGHKRASGRTAFALVLLKLQRQSHLSADLEVYSADENDKPFAMLSLAHYKSRQWKLSSLSTSFCNFLSVYTNSKFKSVKFTKG